MQGLNNKFAIVVMFSLLADKLDDAFRKIRGVARISEKNIAEALQEIRLSLLEADVEYSVAKQFIERVKDQAMGAEVLKSVKPGEQIVKIFRDEMASLLGGQASELQLGGNARIMMVGLNGAGKTTTSAKLALRLKNEGKRPLLVALDLIRPAAIDQLKKLGEQIKVPVYTPLPGSKDVLFEATQALQWAAQQQGNVIIFDTAGRQDIDEALLEELQKLHDLLAPQETLLVVDAATGQKSTQVALSFDSRVKLSGVVLTKLDGDARGGAALSMLSVTGKPIKFAGEGEKLDQFNVFYPDRMADRILGMGDIVSLVEHAASKIDEKDAMKAAQRMSDGKFDFNDFLEQMKMLQKLGPLEGLLGLMPGFNKIKKQMPAGMFDPKKLKHVEAIILSMTPKERARPEIINGSRRKRISLGSGRSLMEVNRLLKNFSEMRKMFKNKGKMMGMLQGMSGVKGLGKGIFG